MTLDVRYLGTIGKKREGLLALNLPNVYYNKELWDALEMTRRGEDAPLFDQMFAGLDVHGDDRNRLWGGRNLAVYRCLATRVRAPAEERNIYKQYRHRQF